MKIVGYFIAFSFLILGILSWLQTAVSGLIIVKKQLTDRRAAAPPFPGLSVTSGVEYGLGRSIFQGLGILVLCVLALFFLLRSKTAAIAIFSIITGALVTGFAALDAWLLRRIVSAGITEANMTRSGLLIVCFSKRWMSLAYMPWLSGRWLTIAGLALMLALIVIG